MRLTRKREPRQDAPERIKAFAILPKKCQTLWGGCGETIWLEKMTGVRFVTALGETIYAPICERCAKSEVEASVGAS